MVTGPERRHGQARSFSQVAIDLQMVAQDLQAFVAVKWKVRELAERERSRLSDQP